MTPPNESTSWTRKSVQVGEWRVTALSDGFFRLDGGAMWGVVPATIWRPMTPPAADNTIRLALRPFLLERGDQKVVVEGGVGDRWTDKLRGIYHIDRSTSLRETVTACGLEPEEITDVVASHCHWDHIGGLVEDREGVLTPLFPNARHYMPGVEFEMVKNPDPIRRGSYRPEDALPLEEAGLVEVYDARGMEDLELFDGLRVRHVGGHSDGVCLVTINEKADGETAVFWTDVVPTTHHIQPPYIMAYDVNAAVSYDQRSALLEEAAREGWIGLFYHDEDHAFGRVTREDRRYVLGHVELIEGE